jgi:membrane protein implicated in regulation of membrane protease activity
MGGLGVVLSILIAVLSLLITITSRLKYRNTLAVTNFAVVALLLITIYRDNRQSRKQGEEQRQTLEATMDDLSGQNRTLIHQNQAFADQITDCNARAEALTKKIHAPVQFTRAISEAGSTKDSVNVKRNK